MEDPMPLKTFKRSVGHVIQERVHREFKINGIGLGVGFVFF
jgi:hypothetical protein